MGRLWHFAPDGTEPTPTGARKLRWSLDVDPVDLY